MSQSLLEMTMVGRDLWLGCADGVPDTHPNAEGKTLDRVQLPGGILFSGLFAKNETLSDISPEIVSRVLEEAILFAAVKMIHFKNPEHVYIAGHNPCVAAGLLDMTMEMVTAKLHDFAEKLADRLGEGHPSIHVVTQTHCGVATWKNKHKVHASLGRGKSLTQLVMDDYHPQLASV